MSMPAVPFSIRTVLDQIANQFQLPDQQLLEITEQLTEEFRLGLREHGRPVVMGSSFITRLPDGTEKGTFLTLDIGWTTLRVSEIKLDGRNNFTQRQKIFRIPDQLKKDEATNFFDYLAESVDKFVNEYGIQSNTGDILQLGLTFPFPIEKTSLVRAKLLAWTKGFLVKNTIGQDVVNLLQDAFDRKRIAVRCTALTNDTVATLVSQSYLSGECLVAGTFGIGINCAFVEQVAKISKLGNPSTSDKMIVNTELGGFNRRTVLPMTTYDVIVDKDSPNPGLQLLEKLVSWQYLAEIIQNIVLSLINQSPPILFNGSSTPALSEYLGFTSKLISMTTQSTSLEDFKQTLVNDLEFEADAVSDRDAEIVRWACEVVATRAVKLAGCAVAASIIHLDLARPGGEESKLVVALDGELTLLYPPFEAHIRRSLRTILGNEVEKQVVIKGVRDGYALGAALCAFEASRFL